MQVIRRIFQGQVTFAMKHPYFADKVSFLFFFFYSVHSYAQTPSPLSTLRCFGSSKPSIIVRSSSSQPQAFF